MHSTSLFGQQELDTKRGQKRGQSYNLIFSCPSPASFTQNIINYRTDPFSRVEAFGEIEMRELTAKEHNLTIDREKGYLGYDDVGGEPLFHCSSYDKIILVWDDCRYRVIPPPEKLFIDKNLVYAAIYDRDRIMTLVYECDQITHMKRFSLGGVIQNKDYFCVPEGETAKSLFFSDAQPETLYVKYAPRKGQQIHQQEFEPKKVAIRTPRTRGIQMTTKRVTAVTTQKPRNWDERAGPKGALID